MTDSNDVPNYSRKRAAALICTCYNHFGAKLDHEVWGKSILEDSLGELPETWNVGLFRLLDEVIYLFRIVGYFSTAATFKDKSQRAQMVLCHQIERNLLAIRILGAAGLDGSSRQNLRALYEMCHALCRCLIDPEFMRDFADQPTLQSANEFWHRYIAKQRTEKFLRKYNETAEKKCILVIGSDVFDRSYEILGVSAHPNFHGWVFDFEAEFSDPGGMDHMFTFDSKKCTELVLSTACHLSLATLNFASEKVAEISVPLGLLSKNPALQQYNSDLEALHGIGKFSGLLMLMLAKWTNRNRPDFNAETHF